MILRMTRMMMREACLHPWVTPACITSCLEDLRPYNWDCQEPRCLWPENTWRRSRNCWPWWLNTRRSVNSRDVSRRWWWSLCCYYSWGMKETWLLPVNLLNFICLMNEWWWMRWESKPEILRCLKQFWYKKSKKNLLKRNWSLHHVLTFKMFCSKIILTSELYESLFLWFYQLVLTILYLEFSNFETDGFIYPRHRVNNFGLIYDEIFLSKNRINLSLLCHNFVYFLRILKNPLVPLSQYGSMLIQTIPEWSEICVNRSIIKNSF